MMENKNNTRAFGFIIIGFTDFPRLHIPLFLMFLFIYSLTLMGNLVLILVICLSPTLYTPMYFFLFNLSSLDMIYTSVTCPKLIHIFTTNNVHISFWECIMQLYFFIAFGSTEYFLLTLMSYDRYVAVCKPLHYTLLMSRRICRIAAICTWVAGILASVPIATVTSQLIYCSSNKINHFFCDITALIQLACSDTIILRSVILTQGVLLVMTSFMLTLISYVHIIFTVIKIQSSTGKYKTFSTCVSHLTVVSIFYFLVFGLYMRPTSTISLNEGKVVTVLYVYFIPMLNPLIYSFRNKDVKLALRRLFRDMACL